MTVMHAFYMVASCPKCGGDVKALCSSDEFNLRDGLPMVRVELPHMAVFECEGCDITLEFPDPDPEWDDDTDEDGDV